LAVNRNMEKQQTKQTKIAAKVSHASCLNPNYLGL